MLKASLKLLFVGVLFLQFLVIPNAIADSLSIATASNFRPVLEQLSKAFTEQDSSNQIAHQINVSSASSGVLYAQILQGAPFQLFFSANESYPEKLVASGHGVADTLAIYAVGKLVLVTRYKGTNSKETSPKKIMLSAKRIAIANPRTAPYGIAAMEVMESLGVADETQPKLVVGNNIAQAWQFFHSGNADVVIAAASLVVPGSSVNKKRQGLFIIDLSSYLTHPVRQSRVAIKPVSPLAQQFLDFMDTPDAEKIISDGGYLLPVTGMNIKP
jgi:molybdate transport system substrate-binding protein